MIHLKLATYAGPAACRPATREYCEKIFDEMDVDKSGELDRSEFEEVMQIVCAQVFTRVSNKLFVTAEKNVAAKTSGVTSGSKFSQASLRS